MIKKSDKLSSCLPCLPDLILIVAAALRLFFATGDLWLDEVWSIINVSRVSSFYGIFTSINSYNNHFLNSIFIYLLGPDAPMISYRIPALAGGILALVFLDGIARRQGFLDAVFALTIAGFSYFFVILCTECRGYGLLMAFSYAALFIAFKILKNNQWSRKNIVLLWGIAIAGFLSHLTFLHVYNGILVWSAYQLAQSGISSREKIRRFLSLHLVILIFVCFYYIVAIRPIIHENGPVRPFFEVIRKLMHYGLGLPMHQGFRFPGLIAVLATAAAGISLYKKSAGNIWTFFLTSALISPVVLFVFFSLFTNLPTNIYAPRHFFINVMFFPLLLARVLSTGFQRNRAGRILVLALLGLFLWSQSAQIIRFARDKRGHYADAMRLMASTSAGRDATVASDHDFRNMFLFDFYKKRISGGQTLHYVRPIPGVPLKPDFFILHDFDARTFPSNMTVSTDVENLSYRLLDIFRYDASGISGYDWYVYALTQ